MWFYSQRSRTERATNARQRPRAERQAGNREQAAVLATYQDRMAELLLDKKLRESRPEDEVRKVARALTLTALSRLNQERRRALVSFLRAANLIGNGPSIIDLQRANLSGADLEGADLRRANLSYVDLTDADLSHANLHGADLSFAKLSIAQLVATNLSETNLSGARLDHADLRRANLSAANLLGADLTSADLTNADLSGANLSHANLSAARVLDQDLDKAASLHKTILPDDSVHP